MTFTSLKKLSRECSRTWSQSWATNVVIPAAKLDESVLVASIRARLSLSFTTISKVSTAAMYPMSATETKDEGRQHKITLFG